MRELEKIVWKQTEDNRWLAYDENETQITGWLHDLSRDTWYYCYSDNIATGWLKDTDERWYYFFTEQSVDYGKQYYKGEMKTGWLKDSNKWYYLVEKSIPSEGIYRGQMLLKTTREIEGVNYTFNESGEWKENTGNGVSDKGIDFIKSFEGFYPNKYYDCVGVLTQGYGLTGDEIKNLPDIITEEKATQLLKDLVNNKYYPPIKKALDKNRVSLSQNQIDALVSMAYNVGYSGVLGSTLFKNICNGVTNENTITNNFCAWSMAGGKQVLGLLRRRQAEARMFLYREYNNN